jgi:hypothetical protein
MGRSILPLGTKQHGAPVETPHRIEPARFRPVLETPMASSPKPDTPANVEEFNTIAGLIFAQLYRAFPGVEDIDRESIAKAMGVVGKDWSAHKLPSGRSFSEMMMFTNNWLASEGYIRALGFHSAEKVMLTEKGLSAMKAVPDGLKDSLGTELRKATERGTFNASSIGDLVGGVIGGAIKSLGSG